MDDQDGSLSSLSSVIPEPPLRESLTQHLYTVPELMRLTRMTRKQVTYWDHIDLVKPTFRDPKAHTGQPAAFYTGSEVIKALVVCHLRRAGFSLRQVQEVAHNLHEHGIQLFKSEAYLLTDGYSIYYAHSDHEVVDILKHHGQMLLLVPIHEHVAKLKKAA